MDRLEPGVDSLFSAADLRNAAEASPDPEQCRRTAAWAIKGVADTGVPDDVATEYFKIVASKFQYLALKLDEC